MGTSRHPVGRSVLRTSGTLLRPRPLRAAGTATLVRPDGYIAWACDDTDPGPRAEALRQALTAWCGAPVRSLGPAAG